MLCQICLSPLLGKGYIDSLMALLMMCPEVCSKCIRAGLPQYSSWGEEYDLKPLSRRLCRLQ